jgi:hypothetical protein
VSSISVNACCFSITIVCFSTMSVADTSSKPSELILILC